MVTFLYNGSLITEDNKSLLKNSLTAIPMKEGSRKKETIRSFFDFIMIKINISCSERKLSEAFPLNFSPKNIGKYLDQYINHYLIYK